MSVIWTINENLEKTLVNANILTLFLIADIQKPRNLIIDALSRP